MDTNTDHQQLVARLQRVAAGAGFVILRGAPLTKFVNTRTGGVLITRDAAVYRKLAEWEEQPFDRSCST